MTWNPIYSPGDSSLLHEVLSRLLIPEDEDVEDGEVERQSQDELNHHHPGEDLVGGPVGCVTVVNAPVGGHVVHQHWQVRSCLPDKRD